MAMDGMTCLVDKMTRLRTAIPTGLRPPAQRCGESFSTTPAFWWTICHSPSSGSAMALMNAALAERSKSFYRYFPLSKRDRKWGLHVTTAGKTRIGPHEDYPPKGHPKRYDFDWAHGRILHDHQAVYISKGRGWFES